MGLLTNSVLLVAGIGTVFQRLNSRCDVHSGAFHGGHHHHDQYSRYCLHWRRQHGQRHHQWLGDPQPHSKITVCDPVEAIRQKHADRGHAVTANPAEAVASAGVVFLAVKPQMVADVGPQLPLNETQIVISILAGTTCSKLDELLPGSPKIIRTMPNTPMAIGQGMVGMAAGPRTTTTDMDLAESLLAPAARVLRVPEDRIDAITAVSGSGPAYIFLFAEAMQAAAMKRGFSKEEADLLVATTMGGSIAYLNAQDGFPAATLREQVTSPGGTTAAALGVFEESGIRATFDRALTAAEDRAKELA